MLQYYREKKLGMFNMFNRKRKKKTITKAKSIIINNNSKQKLSNVNRYPTYQCLKSNCQLFLSFFQSFHCHCQFTNLRHTLSTQTYNCNSP